jgi:hypothetical protein
MSYKTEGLASRFDEDRNLSCRRILRALVRNPGRPACLEPVELEIASRKILSFERFDVRRGPVRFRAHTRLFPDRPLRRTALTDPQHRVIATAFNAVFAFVFLLVLVLSVSVPDEASAASSRSRVCILIERGVLSAENAMSFLTGFRRPFALETLAVEKEESGVSQDVGQIPNPFVLMSGDCIGTRRMIELECLPAGPPGSEVYPPRADFVVRVHSLGGGPLGTADSVTTWRLSPRYAIELPDSLLTREGEEAWEYLSFRYSERAPDLGRTYEIRGWMAGMAILQGLCRRVDVLAKGQDLVFASRGRNH